MAVIVVCGIDEQGKRTVLAIEPMFEESESSYAFLFRELQERGLMKPKLDISDATKGLLRQSAAVSWEQNGSGAKCILSFYEKYFSQCFS